MNGFDAPWRTRKTSDDFDRGRRQQQILRAIWRKARDTGLLANAPQLWSDATQVVKTDLGFEDMLGLLPIALSLDVSKIENFNMIRTYHTTPWQTPDGDFVQLPNYDPIRALLEDFTNRRPK
jgi:anionic cell wall polymer biosynthesis LytR-Cps2A-Psr (LCP) family protein